MHLLIKRKGVIMSKAHEKIISKIDEMADKDIVESDYDEDEYIGDEIFDDYDYGSYKDEDD